jgi:P27 family predicted phage terminase small subunit
MPIRGHKPHPTAKRKLHGYRKKERMNHAEPQPPLLIGAEVPEELAANPVGAREWLRLAPMLKACKQITEADRSALIACCREWSVYVNAVTPARGNQRYNPANKALDHCLKLWAELGLTPSSRTRVHIAEPSGLNGADAFSEFDAAETSGMH